MNYILHLAIYLSVYAIAAMGLNLVVGYCGRLTLAHASYFAVGAYACALAMLKLGWGFLPAAGLGAALAIVLSLAVSLPACRFRGDTFVLVTLAVQTCLYGLLDSWHDPAAGVGTLRNLTNGSQGIPGVPRPSMAGWRLDSMEPLAALAVCLALLCGGATWWLVRSPWGRLLQAVRDDELAARSLGKRPDRARVEAFALGCALASVAGAIYVGYVGFVDPASASLDQSILLLSMVMVGGVGNFAGPVAGALLMLALPEGLRFVNMPDTVAAGVRYMALGLLLMLLMHIRPQGVAGRYRWD